MQIISLKPALGKSLSNGLLNWSEEISKLPFNRGNPLILLTNLFNHLTIESHVLEDASDGAISNILELPMAFGNIYLGETFTSYLSINNDSATAVNDVAFKAELQTSSQRHVFNLLLILQIYTRRYHWCNSYKLY